MILWLDVNGLPAYNVTIIDRYPSRPVQKFESVRVSSGKTKAFNYGPDYDRYFSKITISGNKQSIYYLSILETLDINQAIITLEPGEKIFGSGVDYSQPIVCNITNSSRPWIQDSFPNAEITIELEALHYDNINQDPIFYRSNIPAGLPDRMNYQTPIKRTILKNELATKHEANGIYSKFTEVDNSGDPIFSYIFDITLNQTEEEAAQIEKFVNTQRSTPFLMPNLSELVLYHEQEFRKMMINGFTTNKIDHNNWLLTINAVTNV